MSSAWLVAEGEPDASGWARLPDVKREDLGPEPRGARFARLDRAARLLALGARQALEQRERAGRPLAAERTGVVLASLTGCLAADEHFDDTRARAEGPSPALFPATLPTAPAAELSLRLGLGGPVFSVRAGVRTALALAARLVLRGEADTVLACGIEVAARGAGALLGSPGPFRESVLVLVVERALLAGAAPVSLLGALSLPRAPLLANEEAPLLLGWARGPG